MYDAFDVGAFQYLVKPVDEQKFAEVFGRAAGQIASEAEQRKKKLVIQYGGEGKAIPLNDIYYMESRNHNIILYLKDGNIEYYAKIGDLEEELAGQFYRIHRGYLINLFHMEGYDKTEVRMANGDKLNGLAGCHFAFHSKFCWEHDCRSGEWAADCKNRYGCFCAV
ncbi:hypothetical protein IMSAGC002_03729 [Lachnospiraceae bacterium]|nr:hypothetical protein IMSAGC002_03729 [Lachnospiraceae bacterium]